MGTEYDNKCIVLRYYELMGRKWSYPILYKMQINQDYSFEDFVKLTNREINRTLLSDLLKEFMELGILKKTNGKYRITKKGMELKEIMGEIKQILLKNIDKIPQKWREECLIKKMNG